MISSEKPRKLRVRQRGQITLPSEFRKALGIREDSILTAMRVGEGILLTGKPLFGQEVAARFQEAMKEKGVSLEQLLKGLEKHRKALVKEKYGL
jgi:AbrB family looped-hinge helix DNA binding protein